MDFIVLVMRLFWIGLHDWITFGVILRDVCFLQHRLWQVFTSMNTETTSAGLALLNVNIALKTLLEGKKKKKCCFFISLKIRCSCCMLVFQIHRLS